MRIFRRCFIALIGWLGNAIVVECSRNGTLDKVAEQTFLPEKVGCVYAKSKLTNENLGEILVEHVGEKIDRYLDLFESTVDRNSASTSVFDGLTRDAFDVETGRGRRRRHLQYLQTLLMGAWMVGTVVLGLTIKTIAIVAANAFLAAVFSIVISLVSAHGTDLKSFMGTITNPLAFGAYSTNAQQDAYADGDVNSPDTNAKGHIIRDIDRMLGKNTKSNDAVTMELL